MDIEEQAGRYKRTKFEPIHEATFQNFPDISRAIPISDCCSLEDAGPAPHSLVFIAGRAIPIPADSCVHQLFETQASRTPEAVAVVFEIEQLSYRGLNESANQLAHYLIRMGVGSGTLVGVFWSGRPLCWWRCWGSSRRAGPMYHWIQCLPPIVGSTCWQMRGPRSCSPNRDC